MTAFKLEDITIPAVEKGQEENVPPVYHKLNLQQPKCEKMDEDDELFLGYGFESSCFPYKYLCSYSRELSLKSIKTVTLENEMLRAVFLPEYGGRLWQLYDKKAKRDLLFVNPVFRLGNLSTRNAWFSGGVEFNCGTIGHHPHTCEQINCAHGVMEDGTPYFRMYEFERIRGITYQIDCFLPDNSSFLYVRCRIMNDTAKVVPAYWWSNIAVPAYEHGRVIVHADTAFCQVDCKVHKRTVPIYNSKDITYTDSTVNSFDYFWNIPTENRKYIAHVDKNGYGLVQTSTKRLKGRKLFVWGQSAGSRRWQAFLSDGTKNGNYHEIQAGLGKTQYECVPMPPFAAWEWLEAYGAVSIPANEAHGDWQQAQSSIETSLSAMLNESELEQMLVNTRDFAKQKAPDMITLGSGWGALENVRRLHCNEAPIAPHLNFGEIGPDQQYWYDFLQSGTFAKTESLNSYMRQGEWTALLENAAASKNCGWEVYAHLGLIALSGDQLETAQKFFERSLELKQSSEVLFGMSVLYALKDDEQKCADYATAAASVCPDNSHYAKQAIEKLYNAKRYDKLLETLDNKPVLWEIPRNKLYGVAACLQMGFLQRAEELLKENGGFELPDLREGEIIITELWLKLQSEKEKAGTAEDVNDVPSSFFDFRLQTE